MRGRWPLREGVLWITSGGDLQMARRARAAAMRWCSGQVEAARTSRLAGRVSKAVTFGSPIRLYGHNIRWMCDRNWPSRAQQVSKGVTYEVEEGVQSCQLAAHAGCLVNLERSSALFAIKRCHLRFIGPCSGHKVMHQCDRCWALWPCRLSKSVTIQCTKQAGGHTI